MCKKDITIIWKDIHSRNTKLRHLYSKVDLQHDLVLVCHSDRRKAEKCESNSSLYTMKGIHSRLRNT